MSNDVDMVIAMIVSEHLRLKEARREFREALSAVELIERRDPIASAHNHIHMVSDAAYFYEGLAFGVMLTFL